ncbi:unnamed protein product [Mytilus coruscus]|uniref:Uncharacterized protein n=1 Tax=Mytilus coruscus TaxID=42192 RepID=A0A6J8EPE2_MYTCO|nr:unnamed protein product [Mytilus coruscus]
MKQMKELGDYTKIPIANPRFLGKGSRSNNYINPSSYDETNISLFTPEALPVDRADGKSPNFEGEVSQQGTEDLKEVTTLNQFLYSRELNYYEWENITNDLLILDTIRNGYKISFNVVPQGSSFLNKINFPLHKDEIISEVQKLIATRELLKRLNH